MCREANMKYGIIFLVLLFANSAIAKEKKIKYKEIYSCKGHSQEGLDEPDVFVSVLKARSKYKTEIKLPDIELFTENVIPSDLDKDELSFFNSFSNEEAELLLDISLDDVGGMSLLKYKNMDYPLTCSESL